MHEKDFTKKGKFIAGTFNSRPPQVFAIPRPYEDDYERNTTSYFQIRRLEKKIKKLRKNISDFSKRQELLNRRTREMITTSLLIINELSKRRNKNNVT